MSEKNPIKLFVAHGFEATADYLRVFEYLEHASNFFYVNYSNPEAAPAQGGLPAMKDALREQMRPAEAVIIIASLHGSAPDLLRFQLDCAGALDKPLIAIEPFGGVDPMPEEVAARADVVVGWNEREIVDAIRLQARHEDTQRWEVIDFL
ncbi:MAG: hypothetical protein JJU27_14735 [Gammaproteobacteria bacterium]|nr:hypothetical protein [Gammaproteobacteria bacterium]